MPAIAGLIFSSVSSFQLQPERTKTLNKRDNLDTLSEVYTGPAGGEDSFIPAIGSEHKSYNLMTLLSATAKQLPGLVVEVTLNYQGKLVNSGTGRYTSVPTLSRYWQEGEISYEEGAFTYAHRYTGRCVTIAFITNNILSGSETNVGQAKEFLGFTNEWKQLVSINPGGGFALSQPPIRKMTCTDVRIEDQGDGWYKVTETYMSRMFPGTVTMSTGAAQAPPPQKQTQPFIAIGQPVKDWYGTVPNLFGQDDASSRTTGVQKYRAQQQGQPYNDVPPPKEGENPTADQETFYKISVNTDTGDVTQSVTSALGTTTWTKNTGGGGADNLISVPLDY